LAFLIADFFDISVDPALDRDRIERLDRAHTAHDDRKIFRFRRRSENRDRLRLPIWLAGNLRCVADASCYNKPSPQAEADKDQQNQRQFGRPTDPGSVHLCHSALSVCLTASERLGCAHGQKGY
jgi:hypothetical protein